MLAAVSMLYAAAFFTKYERTIEDFIFIGFGVYYLDRRLRRSGRAEEPIG